MAYLARIDTTDARPLALPASFSPLEWSIIRLSRNDALWTIRPLGSIRRWWNWLVGRGNPALANERLEALRRMTVLSRHFGFTVSGEDVGEFLAAGFTPDQYELLVNSVRRAAATPVRTPAVEARA